MKIRDLNRTAYHDLQQITSTRYFQRLKENSVYVVIQCKKKEEKEEKKMITYGFTENSHAGLRWWLREKRASMACKHCVATFYNQFNMNEYC